MINKLNFNKKKTQLAKGFTVPVDADPVLAPNLIYDEEMTAVYFSDDEGNYCRATFESLDSIRVSRGEFCPYEDDWTEDSPFHWVSSIVNSKWLTDRHSYEHKYYGNSYNFGGNVDEMLSDFSHYLLRFHDQFIEVLAGGIWFEKSKEPLEGKPLTRGHPFLALSQTATEELEVSGIRCQISINDTNPNVLIENAFYCSQTLYEFVPELDGETKISLEVKVRYRDGKLVSILSKSFVGELAVFDGVADLKSVHPYVESWLKEVSARREEMGK